jgi:citrate lyase beta subunit
LVATTLTLWTNDADTAKWADRAGVDRIGLDLENLGKETRQAGLETWQSPHTIADLDRIRHSVERAELFVRTNPFHQGTKAEVDAILDRGVTVLMLPNFTTQAEIADFIKAVAGRAQVVPLVERLLAVDLIQEMKNLGVMEFHVGLNDLSIDLGNRQRIGVLVAPVMERIANCAKNVGLKFGVGGLGRALDEDLPIRSDLIYAQQARLGSSGALIARSFFSRLMNEQEFAGEITRLRARLDDWAVASVTELEAAHEELVQCISAFE